VCGIAASVDLRQEGRAQAWALQMLRHRGPDGEGVFGTSDGNVVLEHTRLAIIDPDNAEANQPFHDASGRWTITYNGEIFNFRELRRDLERAGISFRTASDTEVVLLGFIHEGQRILDRLRGMFAFVIVDRETGDVFAARDPIGVKPFHYLVTDGVFAASSEVRPLLAYPRFVPSFDPAGIVEFLAFGDNPSERTIVHGVRKLLPGHFLQIHRGKISVQQYWDPRRSLYHADPPEDATAAALDRVESAVAAALVSDVAIGLMLSGGIDSSAIAALAVRHVPAAELTAYSVAFGRHDDEAEVALRLASELGIRHRVVRVTEDAIVSQFDDWLSDLDYPSGNPTWIASSFIADAAHSDGIKVLLSGDGGDELFGGYSRWMKYLRFHDRVWSRTPRLARRVAGSATRPFVRGLAADIARRAVNDAGLFVPSRPLHDDALRASLGPTGLAAALASPPEHRIDELRAQFAQHFDGADYLMWMSYVALKTKVVEDFLQRLDRMGMRHSVEGRVPLLDTELAQWALGVPQEVKVPRLRQKALLRAAVAPVLPEYVLDRPKQGFCPPVASWCQKLLDNGSSGGTGPLFDNGILRIGSSRGASAARGDRNAFGAWTMAMLVEWANRNLASAGVASVEPIAA
jgi:asparagine synthase (glutamine-hydrolysing)